MIPINITREHVLRALKKIEQGSVPEGRSSKKFFLNYKGKRFPPKYVISIANLYANGRLLDPSFFSGGKETNNYLMEIGFERKNFGEEANSFLDYYFKRRFLHELNISYKTTRVNIKHCPQITRSYITSSDQGNLCHIIGCVIARSSKDSFALLRTG